MSSDISPSENHEKLPLVKMGWHIQVKTSSMAYRFICDEARRDERSIAFAVSKILENYYETKSKLKIVD